MRKSHFRSRKINVPQNQTGAVLLLFILLLVVGASTLLVSKLNKAAAQYYRDDVTMKALLKAKEALIGYAVSYPENSTNPLLGPGILPCPDRTNDGDIQVLDGEFNCSISAGNFLGRIPWRYMGMDDIRDSSGQVLWYAISDNFRINTSNTLNSETPGQLNWDSDGNGVGDDEDIVAMVIAPLEPVCSQNRIGTANETNSINYLEDVNFDTIPDFVSDGVTQNCNDYITFNDKMLPITRRELMDAVEKRILGDVAQILTTYQQNYGAFPWLSPFQNPKSFTQLFSGTASSGTSGLVLRDASQSIVSVVEGSIIENLTDGSAGVIIDVDGTNRTIAVESLAGGAANIFTTGNQYRIRSTQGIATSGSSGLILEDSSIGVNFSDTTTLGHKPEVSDLIQNLTDGSVGLIQSITPTTISVENLQGGSNNSFTSADSYQFPIYNGQINITQGLLPFHEVGEAFRTGFSVNWNISGTTGTVCSQLGISEVGGHISDLQNALTSGNVVIAPPAHDGVCAWTDQDTVDCTGSQPITITTGAGTDSRCDPAQPFDLAANIARRRFSFDYSGVSSVPSNTNLPLSSTNSKVRNVSLSLPDPAGTLSITITDIDASNNHLGEAILTLNGLEAGSITTNNIHYDLIIGNEIPQWFTTNNWHQLVYIATSTSFAPSASPATCAVGSNCLVLSNDGGTTAINGGNNKDLLVVAAGRSLLTQNRTDSTSTTHSPESEYYETDNNDGDLFFDPGTFRPLLDQFNDKIKIVAPQEIFP